jgi:hypothetical protein
MNFAIAVTASAIEELRLKGTLDPEVIRKVFQLFDHPVLITGDDGMPAEHASVLAEVKATIAVVRPWKERDAFVGRWEGLDHRSEDEWEQEIVHRWAQMIQTQKTGTIRRYAFKSYGEWKPPRRIKRRSARPSSPSG